MVTKEEIMERVRVSLIGPILQYAEAALPEGQFRDGIEDPQLEEIMLIQSNMPELLKFMMEELAIEEE